MADRKTVMVALENCAAEEKCRNCPWDECDGMGHETVNSVPRSLLLDALELLKEQVPVRCKDCKFRRDTILCPLTYIEEAEQFTALCTDEWFCGNGKRR